jgi:hypothetical protein
MFHSDTILKTEMNRAIVEHQHIDGNNTHQELQAPINVFIMTKYTRNGL